MKVFYSVDRRFDLSGFPAQLFVNAYEHNHSMAIMIGRDTLTPVDHEELATALETAAKALRHVVAKFERGEAERTSLGSPVEIAVQHDVA